MKYFLFIEDGQCFVVQCESFEQAREEATIWNAEVIKEIKGEELSDYGIPETKYV